MAERDRLVLGRTSLRHNGVGVDGVQARPHMSGADGRRARHNEAGAVGWLANDAGWYSNWQALGRAGLPEAAQ